MVIFYVQQYTAFFRFWIENIRETVKNFIEQGDNVANLVLDLQKDIFELGRNIVSEVLEGMDAHLRESGLRKQEWEIIRRDPSSVLTSFGWANYSCTYFLSKETGERKFLVDSSVGIYPHDRVTADVVINAIDEADKELLKRVFKRILELTDTETKYNAVSDAKRYIENNWAGIEIKVDNHEIVGCSAEGHISHIFSDRLSSRPMGWSKVGTDKMAQLRIYKKNGGKIYDLVRAQKKKEKQSKEHEIQDKLIRELKKTSSNRYLSTWNSNITILDKGHKTALYNSLRGIINI